MATRVWLADHLVFVAWLLAPIGMYGTTNFIDGDPSSATPFLLAGFRWLPATTSGRPALVSSGLWPEEALQDQELLRLGERRTLISLAGVIGSTVIACALIFSGLMDG